MRVGVVGEGRGGRGVGVGGGESGEGKGKGGRENWEEFGREVVSRMWNELR